MSHKFNWSCRSYESYKSYMSYVHAALIVLSFPMQASAKPVDYFPPPDSQGGWRTLKDAASIRKLAGMDLAKLDQA